MRLDKRWPAAILVLVAVAANPWLARLVLSRLPSLPGHTGRPSVVANILVGELLLLLLAAALVVRRRPGLKIAGLLVLLVLVSLTTHNATRLVNALRRPRANPQQAMLARVEFLAARQAAGLGDETAAIVYSLHQGSDRRSFLVPDAAVLETGVGVDPLITGLYRGKVRFELILHPAGGAARRLHATEIDVGTDPEAFTWRPVSCDLTAYAGREVVVELRKAALETPAERPREVYDLVATDLLFWRLPQVRPRRLRDQPNVVLISLDTVRADHLGFMGYRRDTSPHLDRLAAQGTVFATTVSQAPWTTPSHWSIFTATYPSVHRGNGPVEEGTRYWDDRLPTMASILRARGYLTAAFTGRGPISATFGFCKGFDTYNESDRDANGSDVGLIRDKAVRWLDRHRDRSFFLFLHTFEAHAPYADDYFTSREGIDPQDRVACRTALYDGDVRRTDAFVGDLVAELERLDLLDRTLVVVTSDHGEDLVGRYSLDAGPQHGHTLYDELLLVPLVFYAPGRIPAGRHIAAQVRLIDLLPTVLDLVGLDPEVESPGMAGESLRAMMAGTDLAPRPAFSEATTYGTERESLRAGGWKYVRRLSYGTLATSKQFPNLPVSPPYELYDLRTDPGETVNLADRNPARRAELEELLRALGPERDEAAGVASYRVDVAADGELMGALRTLGYVAEDDP